MTYKKEKPLKKAELYTLRDGLRAAGQFGGAKFAYAVAKNLRLVETEIADLEPARKPSPRFLEYNRLRVELAEQHADRDGQGNAVILNDHYQFTGENRAAFETALGALREEFRADLEERQQVDEEFAKLLEEKTDLQLFQISVEDLPAAITGEILSQIFDIIAE